MIPSSTVGLSLPHLPLMRRIMAALLLGGFCLACLACSSASGSRAPDASHYAQAPLPVELEEGRVLYERRCGTCHELYAPWEYPAAAWPRFVKRYGPRSGLRPSDREKVTAYLQAAAAR